MTLPQKMSLAELAVGSTLDEVVRGPICRATLALFAGASNDHVRLHIDSDFAQAAGMDDVFAHGMLSMAYLGQLLTQAVGAERIRNWHARFTAITPLQATVHCNGEVVEHIEYKGEACARIRLTADTDKGLRTIEGEAIVALEARVGEDPCVAAPVQETSDHGVGLSGRTDQQR